MLENFLRKRILYKATYNAFVYPYNWQILAEAIFGYLKTWAHPFTIDAQENELNVVSWMGAAASGISGVKKNHDIITKAKDFTKQFPKWISDFLDGLSKSLADLGGRHAWIRVRDMVASNEKEALNYAYVNFAETILHRYKNQIERPTSGWVTDRIQEVE